MERHRSLYQRYRMNCRMGEEGRLEISWEDWRDYLLMSPSAELHEIVHFWRHATVSTIQTQQQKSMYS